VSTPALRPTPASGVELVDLARRHQGEPYVLGVFVPKNNPSWKGPWDCAEFVSWVTFQVTGRLYGCERDFGDPSTADAFTGFWERDASELGEAVSVEKAARTPGAVVLRIPAPGAFGHVVISDGTGGTIEAHSPADGVIEGSLAARRWSTGILLPGVEYAEGRSFPVAAPPKTVFRLTMPVMSGPMVRRIQSKLLAAGFDPGVQDGEFGPHTQAAVVAFQLARGLTPDGEVGPETAAALGVRN
jgi:N-acetylmuramoyl-L-alanine amidase